ncbi:MAG: ATP cone domain-containing protein [Candidatus Odinarchaeia archaeon]
MGEIKVVKASGEVEPFSVEKIKRTCIKAGADEELAEEIARKVKAKAYDGITTGEILDYVLRLLTKKRRVIASRYDLKGAIMRLGPSGHPFETFVGELLEKYGYQVKIRKILQGFCVQHEVDIVGAKKVGNRWRRFIVECKYKNNRGEYLGLKEVLYTYARFLDLKEGGRKGTCPQIEEVWVSCNTKPSLDAKMYAKCKNMQLLCWSYPPNMNLRDMIENKKLYPITVLIGLKKHELDAFSNARIMFLKDLLAYTPRELTKITHIPVNRLEYILKEAHEIIHLSNDYIFSEK